MIRTTLVSFRFTDTDSDNLQELLDLARARERRPGGQLWKIDKINRTEMLRLAIADALTKARIEAEAYTKSQDEAEMREVKRQLRTAHHKTRPQRGKRSAIGKRTG